MSSAIRSQLMAGVAVLAAGVLAIPPVVSPITPVAQRTHALAAAPVDLAGSVRPLIVDPPTPQKFAATVAVIERIDPTARSAALRSAPPSALPAPLSTASGVLDSAYQFIQSWVDYGVQLTSYVLGFIPYGYLIADQIDIFYFNLIRPIANSVVYGLIDPVVNQPLNPASYVNGLITVGQTAITAAINTGIAEFNYFFGWLIPPLPPLPLAVTSTVAPVEESAAVTPTARMASEPQPSPEPVVQPQIAVTPEIARDVTQAPTVDLGPETADTPKPQTTTTLNGVQAQGEVRGTTSGPAVTKTDEAESNTSDTTTTQTQTQTQTQTNQSTPEITSPTDEKVPAGAEIGTGDGTDGATSD